MNLKNAALIIFVLLLFTGLLFGNPYSSTGNWRWRNDDGDVYNATWRDSICTPVILENINENIRLRIAVSASMYSPTVSYLKFRTTFYISIKNLVIPVYLFFIFLPAITRRR